MTRLARPAIHRRRRSQGCGRTRAIARLIAVALLGAGCASPPGLSPGPSPLDPGTRLATTAMVPAPALVDALLAQAWDELRRREADDDASGALRVAAVLARLAAAAPVAGREGSATRVDIRLLADPVPDAWCPSLERCAVTRGLLEVVGDDDAVLAAALAHELAHGLLGHPAERLALTGALAPERRVDALLAQPHHQVHEQEVSALAVEWLARAGFDPRAPIVLWSALVPPRPPPSLAPVGSTRSPPAGGFAARHPQAAGWPEMLLRQARRFLPAADADGSGSRGIIGGYPRP
jgi:hypothetical protein